MAEGGESGQVPVQSGKVRKGVFFSLLRKGVKIDRLTFSSLEQCSLSSIFHDACIRNKIIREINCDLFQHIRSFGVAHTWFMRTTKLFS